MHNDEEIVKFCWPSEVLAIINNEAGEAFTGSLSGIARLRDEINFLVRKTLMKREQHMKKLVSADSWVQLDFNNEVEENDPGQENKNS